MVGTVPIYESCPNQIEERLHTSQVVHHSGVYYSFCSMERQGMVLLFSFLVFAVFVNFCLVRIDIPRNQKNRKQRTLAPTKLLIHASLSWLYSEANNIFPFTFFTFFFTDFRHIFLHKRALYNVDVNLTPFLPAPMCGDRRHCLLDPPIWFHRKLKLKSQAEKNPDSRKNRLHD